MADERGGRYFREARFFLAGDKDAAQSHIGEARQILGHLRDIRSHGGPEVLTRYTSLKDGTQIKATMMNGQYQAEIMSSFGKSVSKSFTPTLAGHEDVVAFGDVIATNPFKWQKGTGKVYLGRLPTHDIYRVTKVSDDGSMCAGYARLNGGPIVDWIVWGSGGAPTVVGTNNFADQIDIRFNKPQLFPQPAPFQEAGDYKTQRVGKGKMIYLGSTVNQSNFRYGTATLVTLDPYSEQVLVGETPGADEFHSASRKGGTLFFTQSRSFTHPDTNIQTLRAVRKAVLNETTGIYEPDLSTAMHPALENIGNSGVYCDGSGNTVVAGEVEYYPFSSYSSSTVPVVYTQSTGEFFRLEAHTGDTGGVYARDLVARVICSDASLVAGYGVESSNNNYDYTLAWEKKNGAWSRIQGLDGSFRGQCTATN